MSIPKLIRYDPFLKRTLDILLSYLAILVLSPVLFLVIFFIKLESSGPAFFKHQRIGRQFRSFELIKFRSMNASLNPEKGDFDPGDKSRVTRVGLFLRKTKLDELPELFNVLNGDMSVVGPRPEVKNYVKVYQDDFKIILKIRPGLSDFASIRYRDEESILANQSDPESYYCKVILPDKLQMAKQYLRMISFRTDMGIIRDTIKNLGSNRSKTLSGKE